MRQRKQMSLGVGGSSILMIFIVVCLTTFAALSLISANADYRLTQKTAQATTDYYAADGRATEILATVDGILHTVRETAPGKEAYFVQASAALQEVGCRMTRDGEALWAAYEVPVNERQTLQVVLRILPPPKTLTNYEIHAWQVVNSGEWIGGQEPLNIWQGQ